MLQLSQRPLSGSEFDHRLYVGRTEEVSQISRAAILGFNVLVLGDRGSGRTSLLRQAERQLKAQGATTVFVDAQPWPDAFDLVLAIRAALGDDVREPGYRWETFQDSTMRATGMKRVKEDVRRTLDENWVSVIGRSLEDAPTVLEVPQPDSWSIVVDGVNARAAHTLFGRFRDILWQLPVHWVVSGDAASRQTYLAPPADAFFDTVLELGELTEEEALNLLVRRLDSASDSVDVERLRQVAERLVDGLPERSPRAILTAARAAVIGAGDPAETLHARARQQQQAAALGRGPAMVFAELEQLGPTHAGDERLLERLGYTRPGVVQILKALQQENLVTATKQGRRTLYRIAPPPAGRQ